MIAVTISTPSYASLANQQAEIFRNRSGLDVHVIHSATEEGGYIKKLELASMFRGHTVVFFDADWRLVRDIDFGIFRNTRDFIGVFDPAVLQEGTFLHTDTEALGMKPELYINTGFWIANFRHRDHVKAFNIARQLVEEKSQGRHTGVMDKTEQSFLNCGLQRARTPMELIHPRWNFYLYGLDAGFFPSVPSRIVGLHAAGVPVSDKAAQLDAQEKCLCRSVSSNMTRTPVPGATEAWSRWKIVADDG